MQRNFLILKPIKQNSVQRVHLIIVRYGSTYKKSDKI